MFLQLAGNKKHESMIMKTEIFYLLLLLFPLIPFNAGAQYKILKGTILNDKSESIVGDVNIFDKISGIGTISNANGFFSLMLKQGKPELNISRDGFKSITQSFELKNDTTIIVRLVPEFNPKTKHKQDNPKNLAAKEEEK
jgi:hypothetical protein